jgi:mannose-6-phosphate isomerase-like protein (cupin superfamily)
MKRTQVSSDRRFDVILESDNAQAAVMTLDPSDSTGGPNNRHEDSDQWLYVVSGAGQATIAAESVELTEGDLVVIEAGETHEIVASDTVALETLNLYVPPEY